MEILELEDALDIGGDTDFNRKDLIKRCEKALKGDVSQFDSFDEAQTLAIILTSNTKKLNNLKNKLSKVNFRSNDWEKELVKAVLFELESVDSL
jgi:hypothetical protein